MWRRSEHTAKASRSRQDSGTAQADWDDYDEQLLETIPHVREALSVKRAMERRQSRRLALTGSAVESSDSYNSGKTSPLASSRTHPDPASLRPASAMGASAKRYSTISDVPTASSIYSASPDLNNYRTDTDVPAPLFASRDDAASPPGSRKSSIPVRRQDNGRLSQPGLSGPAKPPSAGRRPAPRQKRDHHSPETNVPLATQPKEMSAQPAISSSSASSTPTFRDNPLRFHPTHRYHHEYDDAEDDSEDSDVDLDLAGLSFAARHNLPALGITLPSRRPWHGASGAADLMTPIEDVTPATTNVAQSTGSVSPVSQFHDLSSLPRQNTQRSRATHDAEPVSPISEGPEPEALSRHVSDKDVGAHPTLQGHIYTVSSNGSPNGRVEPPAEADYETRHGSPGLTLTDFDDGASFASYRPPVPRKNSTRPSSNSRDKPAKDLPERSDTPSSIGSAIRRKKIRNDDEWIDRSLPPSAAKYQTSIDPVGPRQDYDWTAQEESDAALAPVTPVKSRRHLTPEATTQSRRNVSAPAETPEPASHFSWSTQQTRSVSTPKSSGVPPVPALQTDQIARKTPVKSPKSPEPLVDSSVEQDVDQNVYSWGGKPPVWVMDRQKHNYDPDRVQTQQVYVPYRSPETPDNTPPPVMHPVSRDGARTPTSVNQNSIMNRTRPLTRRAEDGSYTPKEDSSCFVLLHPPVQQQIRRKPTPSEMPSQTLSPPASPPRSSAGTAPEAKELPKAPPELDSIDYITALGAEIDALDLRKRNIARVIEKRQEEVTDPIKFDRAGRQREKENIAALERQLDDVKLKIQETGVKLHRAWKRREQEACTALWVRRRGN